VRIAAAAALLAAALGSGALASAAGSAALATTDGATVVTPAPADEPVFADLEGRSVRVSQRRGDVVLLNFWSTWCGPCRTEMPVFVRLDRDLRSRGLRVLGVAANGRDEADAVRRVADELGVRFEVWLWANAFDMARYGVGPGLPATLVLDRDGRVVRRFQGPVTEADVRPVVEALLPPAGR